MIRSWVLVAAMALLWIVTSVYSLRLIRDYHTTTSRHDNQMGV